jgi:hypothetical protein
MVAEDPLILFRPLLLVAAAAFAIGFLAYVILGPRPHAVSPSSWPATSEVELPARVGAA